MMIHHGVCRSAAHGVVREVGCVTQKRQGFDFLAGLYRATTEMTFIRRCVLQVCCAGLIRRAFHRMPYNDRLRKKLKGSSTRPERTVYQHSNTNIGYVHTTDGC